MKRKIFWMLLSLVAAVTGATARQLTPAEALERAMQGNAAGAARAQMFVAEAPVFTAVYNQKNCFYVFNRTGGFLMVSSDDVAPAILAYSDQGTFDESRMPEAARMWMEGYREMIAFAAEKGIPLNAIGEAGTRPAVEPLVPCRWGQESPFNGKCPVMAGYRSQTGCVATAMAQVMYSYKWPKTGKGSVSYTNAVSFAMAGVGILRDTVQVDAVFEGVEYDWDNMIDNYSTVEYTAAQADAAATLMFHCGAGAKMTYSPEISTTTTQFAMYAMCKYFDYDYGMSYHEKKDYNDDEWDDLLHSELEAGRPMLYGGCQSGGGGHQFVMDGCDNQGLYHINWGWDGSADGYFTIMGTNPLNPYFSGAGGGTAGEGFGMRQDVLTGIRPNAGTPEPGPEVEFAPYTLDKNTVNRGDVVILSGKYGKASLYDGITFLGVRYENVETHETYDEMVGELPLDLGYVGEAMKFYATVPLNGTYRITPVYKGKLEDEWKLVVLSEEQTEQLLTVQGDERPAVAAGKMYIAEAVDNRFNPTEPFTVVMPVKVYTNANNMYFSVICADAVTGETVAVQKKTLNLNRDMTTEIRVPFGAMSQLESGKDYVFQMWMSDGVNYDEVLLPGYYNTWDFTADVNTSIGGVETDLVAPRLKCSGAVYGMGGIKLFETGDLRRQWDALDKGIYLWNGKKIVK